MSEALRCDNCGTTLTVDHNGEDDAGEVYAWIRIGIKGERHLDACTRQCAHELLDDEAFIAAVDEKHAQVAEIARVIREHREEDGK